MKLAIGFYYFETLLNFRVLKDFKGKAAMHVEWVKAWAQCLAELQVHHGGGDGGHGGGNGGGDAGDDPADGGDHGDDHGDNSEDKD